MRWGILALLLIGAALLASKHDDYTHVRRRYASVLEVLLLAYVTVAAVAASGRWWAVVPMVLIGWFLVMAEFSFVAIVVEVRGEGLIFGIVPLLGSVLALIL